MMSSSRQFRLRPLGSARLETSPLVLGGNVFGWTADPEPSFAILDAFVDGGGTTIDTADAYSKDPNDDEVGSEAIIGAWLRSSGKRDSVLIVSKIGCGGLVIDPARWETTRHEQISDWGHVWAWQKALEQPAG